MSVIRLLNGDVAPADVIAEFVQPFRFLQYHLFDFERFFQATIRDFYWQLHSGSIVRPAGSSRQALHFGCGSIVCGGARCCAPRTRSEPDWR
jgi:hypothetical protein